MTELAERLLHRYYRDKPHPYRLFEQQVEGLIRGGGVKVLLDAGCGRTVPVLRKFLGKADRLVGVELVDFTDVPEGIEVHNSDLAHLPLDDGSVDLIMSRSVFEHLTDPAAVYAEFARVLGPGGRVVFLTANMWDYGTMAARLIPNRFHARIVKAVEGREEEDTFPTAFKTNTRRDVDALAAGSGFSVQQYDYLSQYPNYLMFNGALFLLGTAYEKLISRFEALRYLRGWILVTLVKQGVPASRVASSAA
jgi:SAM-dependent methyltransferase